MPLVNIFKRNKKDVKQTEQHNTSGTVPKDVSFQANTTENKLECPDELVIESTTENASECDPKFRDCSQTKHEPESCLVIDRCAQHTSEEECSSSKAEIETEDQRLGDFTSSDMELVSKSDFKETIDNEDQSIMMSCDRPDEHQELEPENIKQSHSKSDVPQEDHILDSSQANVSIRGDITVSVKGISISDDETSEKEKSTVYCQNQADFGILLTKISGLRPDVEENAIVSSTSSDVEPLALPETSQSSEIPVDTVILLKDLKIVESISDQTCDKDISAINNVVSEDEPEINVGVTETKLDNLCSEPSNTAINDKLQDLTEGTPQGTILESGILEEEKNTILLGDTTASSTVLQNSVGLTVDENLFDAYLEINSEKEITDSINSVSNSSKTETQSPHEEIVKPNNDMDNRENNIGSEQECSTLCSSPQKHMAELLPSETIEKESSENELQNKPHEIKEEENQVEEFPNSQSEAKRDMNPPIQRDNLNCAPINELEKDCSGNVCAHNDSVEQASLVEGKDIEVVADQNDATSLDNACDSTNVGLHDDLAPMLESQGKSEWSFDQIPVQEDNEQNLVDDSSCSLLTDDEINNQYEFAPEKTDVHNWKVGYLEVKRPTKSRKAKLKAWQKRWVVIQSDEFTSDSKMPSLMLSIYHSESGNSRRHSAMFWRSVSSKAAIIYRSSSRTHPYAFTISDGTDAVLHMAADSETLSQEWIAAIRTIMWPPNNVVQLEKVLSGNEFDVSIIDNDFAFRAGLLGTYGYLTVTNRKLILCHPQSGHVIQEWYLNTVNKFQMLHQPKEIDANKVLLMYTSKDSSTGYGEIRLFCVEAVNFLKCLASTIHKVLQFHSKNNDKCYKRELDELAGWLTPQPSRSGTRPANAEGYYQVPPRQVRSLLDIPNFIFDMPTQMIAVGEALTSDMKSSSSLKVSKTNVSNFSQDSGVSVTMPAEDFFNSSATSFTIGNRTIRSQDRSSSESSEGFSPPSTPQANKKATNIPE